MGDEEAEKAVCLLLMQGTNLQVRMSKTQKTRVRSSGEWQVERVGAKPKELLDGNTLKYLKGEISRVLGGNAGIFVNGYPLLLRPLIILNLRMP